MSRLPRTRSLGKAVLLLQALAGFADGASASALARATGLPRSTVVRTLRTLADFGLVEEAAPGAWALGRELVRLARAADPHRRLLAAARGPLARLRDRTGESAVLAVPTAGPGIDIILQLDPPRHVGVASWVGAEVPLHASAAGKLVLAELGEEELERWLASHALERFTERTLADPAALRRELARVRRQGWAELVDELEVGLVSLSAPVRDPGGALAALVGVSGPTFRLPRAQRRALVPAILAAAAEVEAAAAGRSPEQGGYPAEASSSA